MKKLVLALFLFIGFTYVAEAQATFEYDLKIEKTIVDNKVTADVTVIITVGNTPVKYQIMNYGDAYGTPIVESGFTKKTKYKFTNIPSGKYLIKLIDKEGLYAFKPFEIKDE